MAWTDRTLASLTASGVFYTLCKMSTGVDWYFFAVMTGLCSLAAFLALLGDLTKAPLD